MNFGWPCYEGPAVHKPWDTLHKPLCDSLYAAGAGAVAAPHWAYDHGAAVDQCPAGASSVSGVAFASEGGGYPAAYRGGVFVSDYSRDCIWYLPRGADGLPDPARASTFLHGGAHPVELEIAPDGSLVYADLNDGSIVKVSYTRLTAAATASPTSGVAPLAVQLDANGSTGSGLAYSWDLNGDGQFGDATGASPTHTFPAGTFTVRAQVTDATGASVLSAPMTISVSAAAAPAPAAAAPPKTVVAGARVPKRLVRRHAPVVAGAGGIVRLRVYCPSRVACSASLAVRAATGGQTLTHAHFKVHARRTKTVRLRLTAAARRRLARLGHLRVISVLKLVPARGTTQRIDTIFTLRSPVARR